jgi:starch synthase
LHIVFAASECVPYAKTGGLADVVGALTPELVKLGHQITVYLPLYPQARKHLPEKLTIAISSLTIPFDHYNRFAAIVDGGKIAGVQHYFVDCPELFDRPELYGPKGSEYPDNAERFALFSRAVVEAAKQLGVPRIFHVHDWQAALIPVYLRTLYYYDPLFQSTSCVLTIHNAGYQGWFPASTTQRLLFPWELFTMDKLEHFDTFNFLKGGLVYSDILTTVSRKYAAEIQTPEFGNNLENVLTRRTADLRGILNGVDYNEWNPATDKNLIANFSPSDLTGKDACRNDLLKSFGLQQLAYSTPVLGIVSRLATQKGFDLVAQIASALDERDLAIIVLGSGEGVYERFFRNWAAARPDRVAVHIGYSDELAHRIEAGADIFLMPSRYEPCGLNQIYSLKYGTVPVVRATGGLDDTIEEWNPEKLSGTGFKFEGYLASSFLDAVDRALVAYSKPPTWQRLMLNGMAREYSWTAAAKEYVAVYEEAAGRRV